MPQTVRIPELPPRTTGLDLSFSDLLPIYIDAENKTRKVDLQSLYTFFQTGGNGGSHAPVEYGGMMIYRVPDDIPEGTITVAIPSLAGKDFFLRRGGLPMIPQTDPERPDAQFEILDAGGFELIQDGDQLNPGELFELFIFSLIAQTPGPTPGTPSSSSFIKGKKTISTNTVLDVAQDLNKIIQVRANTDIIALTLPDVEDVSENSCVFVETNINNTKPLTVTTTGGQFIYLKSSAYTTLYMHPGEVLWLFRDEDGWYGINDFYQNYKQIGKPFATYKVDPKDNEIICKGQEVLRADHPRLWEYANSTASMVDEATWQTASATVNGKVIPFPYKGCFSSGNGTTTFRLPDLMNHFLRGLKSETGSDSERLLNKAGIIQGDLVGQHAHNIWGQDNTAPPSGGISPEVGNVENPPPADTPVPPAYFKKKTSRIGDDIGVETRPANVGILWAMKY